MFKDNTNPVLVDFIAAPETTGFESPTFVIVALAVIPAVVGIDACKVSVTVMLKSELALKGEVKSCFSEVITTGIPSENRESKVRAEAIEYESSKLASPFK